MAAAREALRMNRVEHFNQEVDTAVTAIFLVLVTVIAAISFREWYLLLSRRRVADLRESDTILLPDYALAEARPVPVLGIVTIGFALAKELSGEAHLERARQTEATCHCACDVESAAGKMADNAKSPQQLYVEMTEKRFNGVTRCC
jgi:carbon starvation protein